MQAVFIVGECALALLAYLVRGWRALVLLCAGICAALLPTVFLVPESPRWLLSQVWDRCAFGAEVHKLHMSCSNSTA